MPNFSENPSFNSQRVQKASRINTIESARLMKRLQLLEKERQTHLRMTHREMRILHLTMDHIKASSGRSPEGIADDEEFIEKKGDIVSCFLYGDRTQSRRFGKFRRVQSSAVRKPPSGPEEDDDDATDGKAAAATLRTNRPHTSPGPRRAIVWGGRTIPVGRRGRSVSAKDKELSYAFTTPVGSDADSDSETFAKQDDADTDDDAEETPPKPLLLTLPRNVRSLSATGNDHLPVPFSNQAALSNKLANDEAVKDLGEAFRHKASMRERTISKRRQDSASQVSIVKSSEKRSSLAKVVNQARALTMAVSKWRRLGGMPGIGCPVSYEREDEGSMFKKVLDKQRQKSLIGKIENFMDQYPISQES